MTKHRAFLKAIPAAILLCASSLAAASGTTNVDVDATVPSVCTFSAGTMAAINLGSLNPSTVGAAGVTNTGNITYNCTRGLTPVVTKTVGGTLLTETTTSETIAYTFTLGTPEDGLGYVTPGSSKVVATATVTQAAVQGAAAGTYKDTVTLSINN